MAFCLNTVMAVESMDIDQDEPRQAGGDMVGKEGGMIAVKVEDEQLPQVAISGVCAHAGCGQVRLKDVRLGM